MEMNLHVPQSMVSQNELIEIAAVPYQIMSPKECKPLVAVVQDVALGIYRLTKKHITLSEKQFFNLLSTNTKFYGNIPKPLLADGDVKKWSGRQALSAIIPDNVNIRSANNSFNSKGNDPENFVVIENGQIVQGTLDKKIYQNRTSGLIHSIYNDCNPDETRQFFDNTQKLICNWLVNSGFSIGISDLIVDEETKSTIRDSIHAMKVNAYNMIKDVHMGRFENHSIKNNNEYFEEKINKILNDAREQTGKLGLSKINDMENRMINMIKSGSKGSVINVAQMIACLGQQNVDGKRIAYGFENRTLPHFFKFDDGPESRGFVENSFIVGLSPQEFFFHSMGGREGLIDTAVKSVTSDTKVLVIEDNKPKVVEIGPWIDEHMARGKDRVQYKEDKNTELLELENTVYIPNMDSKGNMQWSAMKYVTRHDPDNELYEVTTQGGRKVVVTQYDSMLVWDHNKQEFLTKPTKSILPGEFVPVTSKFPVPPTILDHVDVSEYLSKTEFLYGSDFWKAKEMMEEAMQDRHHIPSGWWEEHNGKEFTLPYTSKARVQRVLVRSDVNAIKPGCVHNYAAQRGVCSIPDTFPLDKEFGTFIGLYLAEGCCHVKSGKVSITNNDAKVQSFIKQWFDKYHIKHWEEKRETCIKNKNEEVVSHGTTHSIEGNSTMLAKFLDLFVGHGSAKKHVPKEAFGGSDEFVMGLLSGYFAGDGCVGSNYIAASSASEDLIQGISLLCTRFGAFGKIGRKQLQCNNVGTTHIHPSFTLDIRSRFAQRLRSKLDLIIDYKNERLKNLACSQSHRKYPEENDVVMDAVVSITPVDATLHPKVYDVTVPGTYNFAIANGLNIHDTSETGYIQRKLVKAMEDCKIGYDYTVRNASGSIIQFLYGDDGMDPIKIEAQKLPTIEMDYPTLRKEYLLTPEDDLSLYLDEKTLRTFQSQPKWEEKCRKHFDQVLEDREYMITKIFHGKQESSFMYPVSFSRILGNAKAMLHKYGKLTHTDLSPLYVLESVDALCEELYVSKNTRGTHFMKVLLRAYLSPKAMIQKYRFNKDTFDLVLNQVRARFYDSIASPSELVGVVAAQSIGEPCTQLTLNTFHSSGISSASKAVRGVPRIKELLSVTKNIKGPAMIIHVKDEFKKDKMKANDILKSITTTFFKDIVKSSRIYYDPSDFETTVEKDRNFIQTYKELVDNELLQLNNVSPWLLRFEFDKDKMLEEGVNMLDLYNVLQDYYDDTIQCMFSDDNSDNMIFRIKLVDDGDPDRDYITELKALEKNILENILIKGIKGIRRSMMNKEEYNLYNPETMTFEKTYEWVLDTSGNNLVEVMGHPKVDYTKTVSNDVNEIYDVLGIEAARQALYNELSGVISDAELYVNYRHMALLVDTMTNRGYLLSIDRHGINRVDIGPLAKCSFEETTDMLIKAGIFSEVDRITGVSANIMLGQIPPCGTGESEILMDEYKLMEALMPSTEGSASTEAVTDADTCTLESLSFDFRLPGKEEALEPVQAVEVKIV